MSASRPSLSSVTAMCWSSAADIDDSCSPRSRLHSSAGPWAGRARARSTWSMVDRRPARRSRACSSESLTSLSSRVGSRIVESSAKEGDMAITEPLRGLRVIDCTDGWGELCGRLLGDLGADVVRVEPPEGSRSRHLAPTHDGLGLFHAYRNIGKRPLSLDLGTDEGRRAMEEMLAGADVLIESSRPGESDTGLDPAGVLSLHPHLVVTSITPFGRRGPYRIWEASDSVIEAMSGMMFKAGIPSKPPLIPPSQIANDIASTTAAFATLAACWQKARTGHGQHIDLSVMAATAQTTDWSMSSASVSRARGLPYNEVRNGSGPV